MKEQPLTKQKTVLIRPEHIGAVLILLLAALFAGFMTGCWDFNQCQ